MELVNLIGEVIYIDNRVWTIYSSTQNGVFCYQGVKLYDGYKYDSNHSAETAYYDLTDISDRFITGEQIDFLLKKMKLEENKPLSKKKAIEFFSLLTGHNKTFISKNIREHDYATATYSFVPGTIAFEVHKVDNALYLEHNIDGVTNGVFYDYLTYKPNDILNERSKEAKKQEIIDNYKEANGIK